MKDAGTGSLVKQYTAAIAGNPNSGKTTLFNGLTGGNQRIGNWPGVTVEKKEGTIGKNSEKIRLVDLPGIYAFHSTSEDERIAQDFLMTEKPDLVVNIVDASNLERNLYLTVQLIEMNMPVIVILNMTDIAEQEGISIDTGSLERQLGVPVYSMIATQGEHIKKIRHTLLSHRISDYRKARSSQNLIEYQESIQKYVDTWAGQGESPGLEPWMVVKILEGNEYVTEASLKNGELTEADVAAAQQHILNAEGAEVDILIANAKYEFIRKTAENCIRRRAWEKSLSDRIDDVVLNRFLGIPVFLGIMYLAFWLAVNVGFAFIDFFDILAGTFFVDGPAVLLGSIGSPAWLTAILADGIGAGIQTVATFIPVVFFMFLVLSMLEDSGYMARAAFVMDRVMRTIGLPGKAFVPMMVGFGCTIPAMLGTRTLENKRDRFLTLFITPFMSCGARLPVYALFGAAFFGPRAGGIVFSIYMIGILMAIGTGFLLRRTLFRGGDSTFVMELPRYHLPTLKNTFGSIWKRLSFFIRRAGKAIIVVVLALSVFNSLGTDGSFGNEDSEESVLSATGKVITPIFTPMGIEITNWPATVGLFTGLFAKEVIVGTLNSLYAQGTENEIENSGEEFSLSGGIVEAFTALGEGLTGIFTGLSATLGLDMIGLDESSTADIVEVEGSVFKGMRSQFNPHSAYAYLLFVLLYFPCVAAFGTAIQEMGWKYGIIQAAYLTLLAWSTATLFYQLTVVRNPVFIALP
ncbi:MAG: Fe(2+) transporter permease subunit FeoB, partial [Spirochaetota bacterium]|nr:Fe(2+) transporter permease subunit FeoB [Spirochaetota bacterium]